MLQRRLRARLQAGELRCASHSVPAFLLRVPLGRYGSADSGEKHQRLAQVVERKPRFFEANAVPADSFRIFSRALSERPKADVSRFRLSGRLVREADAAVSRAFCSFFILLGLAVGAPKMR